MNPKFDESLLGISDGRLYSSADMVRVGCHDCAGCSDCCQGMGDTILLDPYDMNRLTKGLGRSFEELLQGPVELHLEEGLILPNLRMVSWTDKLGADEGRDAEEQTLTTPQTAEEACYFLNLQGRCSIHPLRPGFCRLFPLGRSYQEDNLSYFLLANECPVQNKTKMKLEKWLDQPKLRDYQAFLVLWHKVTGAMREEVTRDPEAVEANRRTSLTFLQYFYAKPYGEEFFPEFKERVLALGIR